MNILKHMEAVFVAAAVFAVGGSYALDTLPQAHAKAAVIASADTSAPVVVIKAKRMSAEEKRLSLQADQLAGAAAPASRL
jgi:hypothetical protein